MDGSANAIIAVFAVIALVVVLFAIHISGAFDLLWFTRDDGTAVVGLARYLAPVPPVQ